MRQARGNGILTTATTAAAIACALGLQGCAVHGGGDRKVASVGDESDGLAAFHYVHKVTVESARCVNCHVPGDRPMQLEGAARRLHPMNVQRRIETLGMRCVSCHGMRNFDQEHLPPGTTLRGQAHWGMPRAHKAFTKDTTAAQLCQLWKDPRRNEFESDDPATGHREGDSRTPEELLAHVAADPLVVWTWAPGPGRTPSSGTHDEFVKNFATWVNSGAPCPEGGS